MNMPRRKQTGFTIVELLIVIVVIGILAAITIVAYNGVQGRARDTHRISDLSTIIKALELYKISNGTYPSPNSTPNAFGWEVSTDGTTATDFLAPLVSSDIISSVPVDPQNKADNPSYLGPDWGDVNYMYYYYRYPAGTSGCDPSKGAFYVLGVTRMDTVPADQSHPDSPGFQCSERDWKDTGAWVTGHFVNG